MNNAKEVSRYPVDYDFEKQVHNWFTYHQPHGDQVQRYALLRDEARELAFLICKIVPPGADRATAIRKLRECVMTANAAIACESKE